MAARESRTPGAHSNAMRAARPRNGHATDDTQLYPTPERLQRGQVEILDHAIADEEGHPSQRFTAIDTLAVLWQGLEVAGSAGERSLPTMRRCGDRRRGSQARR